jgi:glycosyltransferase involved in cell wall biosynthesis
MSAAESCPDVIVYTHSLLEGSMTFIKTQAEAFDRHRPIYVGAHRVDGIDLPTERTYVVNSAWPLGVFYEALFRKWHYAPGLIKKLKKHDPRIVHTHFGTCGPAGMAIANALNIPLVVTFHGQDATMKEEVARKTFRGRDLLSKKARLIERTDLFIAVSNHIRDCLIEQGYPEEKITVHRNGIDLQTFKPKQEKDSEPIIVFVGRFVEKKGIRYLIDAATLLHAAKVQFELVIIGSGPLEPELKSMAEESGISCTFTGFLSAEEVREWVSRARVVAVPSVVAQDGDSEGLPTILLEAQAMETPVVGTFHSGIPEGVIAGKTAELVDERNAIDLASELRSFLESPEKSIQFGRAGRALMMENFDMRTQNRKLEDLFDMLRSLYPS